MKYILNALLVQCRVIRALMLREVHTIYGHTKLGYLWVFVQSAFNIAVFWAFREFMGSSSPHGISVGMFLLSGFCTWTVLSDGITKCMSAYSGNKSILYFPQVTLLDIMIARILVIWFTQIVVAIFFTLILSFFDEIGSVENYGAFFSALFITPLLALGLGSTLASAAVYLPALERLVPLIFRILFFASGVFFSASTFSDNIAQILLYNPIMQIIEMLRTSISYGYPSDSCSWAYVYEFTLITLFIGLPLEVYVRKKRKD